MTTTLELDDLVGLPYRFGGTDPATGVDCLWASRRVLERVFHDLDPAELPVTAEEEQAALDMMHAGAHRWMLLVPGSTNRKLGDLIHGRREGGGSFVAVVIDERGPLAFTALPGIGTTRIAVRRLSGIEATYRRRP